MCDSCDLNSLWNFRDAAESERRFRELLPAAESDPAFQAEVLSQIARTYNMRRQFAEAHALLDEAEALLFETAHRARVRCLLERGRGHNSNGNPKAALPLFESAYALACEHNLNYLTVDAAHMMALAHPDADERIRWGLRTVETVESGTDESVKRWLGPLYNNLGWTIHERGDYARSLQYLEKAQAYHDRYGDEKAKFIARWSVAKLLRLNGRLEESLAIAQSLESELSPINDMDPLVYEELGEVYLLLNHPGIAREYFRKAYPLMQKVEWLTRSEPARVERIGKLAGIQPPSPSAR